MAITNCIASGEAMPEQVDFSSVTLDASEVLDGYLFYDSSGVLTEGTMSIAEPQSYTFTSTGEKYYIPEGYHNGTETVVADIPSTLVGTDTRDTTLEQWAALKGYYYYDSTGTRVQGTMTTASPTSTTLTYSGATYTIPAGYCSGGQVIKASISYDGTDVSDTNLDPSMALEGYGYYDAGGNWTEGTMPNLGGGTVRLDMNTTEWYPEFGYYDGTGKVTVTTQTKTVMPTPWSQYVTPDEGNVLKSVVVQGMGASGVTTYVTYQAYANTYGFDNHPSELAFELNGTEILSNGTVKEIFVYLSEASEFYPVEDDTYLVFGTSSDGSVWSLMSGQGTSRHSIGADRISSRDVSISYYDNDIITIYCGSSSYGFCANAQYCLLLLVAPNAS